MTSPTKTDLVFALIVAGVVTACLTDPVHAWLHAHVQLLLGIFLGSTAELFIVCGLPWLRDRWHWLLWFSWQ
jgi:hypothetical protein